MSRLSYCLTYYENVQLIGMSTKSEKSYYNISFVMSVCLAICMKQLKVGENKCLRITLK